MTSNISEAAKSQPLGFGQYHSLAPARRQTANDQTTCVRTDRRGVEPETIGISPEAKDAWIVFHDTVETALGLDGELYEIRAWRPKRLTTWEVTCKPQLQKK